MFVEGHIETTSLQEGCSLDLTRGLDTTEEHRLLDQRILLEIESRESLIHGAFKSLRS